MSEIAYLIADPRTGSHELLVRGDEGDYRSDPSQQLELELHPGCMISLDLTNLFAA